MKRVAVAAVAFVGVFCAVFADDVSLSANATLKDGSVVKGEFLTKAINGSTLFSKTLALDSRNVRSLAFSNTNGEAKVELANGDKFAIKVTDPTLTIKSLLGDLKIPRENFRSITLSKKKKGNSASSDGLVFHCTFDDEGSITSPAKGPQGVVLSRDFVEGRFGKAIRVSKGGSAGFFSLPPETFGSEGCIEFWAKIDPSRDYFGDCDPRMIFIKNPAGWFTVEYSSNNGAGRGGFCVRCFGVNYIKGGSCGMSRRYSDFISDIYGWHHYAFSWSKDTLTVYIDGKKLEGMFRYEGEKIDGECLRKLPSVMVLPNSKINPYNTEPNSPFVMDELKIWDYAKEDFNLE